MSSHSGRRRSNVRQYSAEDQALTQISKEAENRLAAKRAARAEAREIRMKEIERQQREQEEKLNNEPIRVTKTRQHNTGSRRGSDDSSEGSGDAPSGKDRDLRMELRSLEEKYKAAMMSSAQLDNEKQSLVYQVELLKDQLEEQAESYVELQREYKDKCRDLEMKKRELQAAEVELKALRDANDYKDRLIAESGLTIVAAENGELALERTNESPSTNGPVSTGAVLLSAEAMDLLNKSSQGSLGMQCLASHASHTSYPTPSSSTSTTQQLGSSESSRLVGDGDSMVKATSADTLAQGIESPDSHPLANNVKDSSQTEDQTDSGEIDKIFSSKTNAITGPELGQSEREAVVADIAKSLIEIETSFSVGIEAKKLEKTDVAKTSTESTVISDVETLVLVERTESGESEADGELSVPLDHSSSNKCGSEQNTACHLPSVNLDKGSSDYSAIICDSVLPPDEPLKESEHFLNEKVQDTFKASSDHPTVVVTVSSHSQQNSSDVTESEDDGEEFFDAVSTPFPSPSHFSADSEVKDLNLLKSCEEGVLEGKATEVKVGEEGREKDLGNGNGHLDGSLSGVGTAKDAAEIDLSKPPFDDTDASQSQEYPEVDKQIVVETAHTQGPKGGCTEGSQDHKKEEVGVSIETNASSQQEDTAQEDVKESDSLAELSGLEAFDTKGAFQRENVDSADANKCMGESLAGDGEREKDDTSESDKDKSMLTVDICKEETLLADDVHDESKTSQDSSEGENTYDKARVCEGISEIDYVASEGSECKAKVIGNIFEGENVANNSSDKEKFLLHDGENGALGSSDCEISVSADVIEGQEYLSVDRNGIKTMPDDIKRESGPFESNEGESRLLEDANTEENDRSAENTLADPYTSVTAAEAIPDNSKMDELIETTESVKGDAKLSEDASAEENDETTQNTLCEADTSVTAAEAIPDNSEMDEPIETTESVKGDAKLSEDASAEENDETTQNTLCEADTLVTAAEAIPDNSEMDEPIETTESVKGDAKLSEDASAEENDETTQNTLCEADTSVTAAEAIPDNSEKDEPIETTESVKGDAKLSEDASAEENDETTQNTLCEADTLVTAAEAIPDNSKMDELIETTEGVKGEVKLTEDVSAGENDESCDAFPDHSKMVKPFESKEESVKGEANLSEEASTEETEGLIKNAHAGACTSVVAADSCPDHNTTGKPDDRREDCMSDIIEGEVQTGEKIEKATCNEAVLTSNLDERGELEVKCKDNLDVALLTLNSTENSRQDQNEGDYSDDQSRPPESSLCEEDGNSSILISEKSSDATVCVPVENVSFPISLKEETNFSNSVENTSSSNESALLEDARSFEEGVSKDDVTAAQRERQLENILPSCIQDITTSSEFEQNERDGVNKETTSEGAESTENKLCEENTVEAAEDEENQEGIDAAPPPTADVKAKDNDGWESENSEALLDEEYDFDDIDEVLDDSDKGKTYKDTNIQQDIVGLEDVASIVSKDSGLPESFATKDSNAASKDDLTSVTSQELDVSDVGPSSQVGDSTSDLSEDNGTRKSFLGAEVNHIPQAVSMESLDLEAKLDKLASSTSEHGKHEEGKAKGKDHHGSHKKSKKFKFFNKLFK